MPGGGLRTVGTGSSMQACGWAHNMLARVRVCSVSASNLKGTRHRKSSRARRPEESAQQSPQQVSSNVEGLEFCTQKWGHMLWAEVSSTVLCGMSMLSFHLDPNHKFIMRIFNTAGDISASTSLRVV